MKETRTIEEYGGTWQPAMDAYVQWLYGLFGWKYVKTGANENRYVEKKNYLVSEGEGRYRLESGYRCTGHSYNITHYFERDTKDPKYERYCALEKRMGARLKSNPNGYESLKKLMKSVCPKGVPRSPKSFARRYIKFYVIGVPMLTVALLYLLADGAAIIKGGLEGNEGLLACLGLGGFSTLCGVFIHIKMSIKSVFEREYWKHVGKRLSKEKYPGLSNIIEEALKLQMED